MSEETSFIQRNGDKAKNAVTGLSAAAVIWIYSTFPSQRQFDQMKERAAEEHRDAMDRENQCDTREKACFERFTRMALHATATNSILTTDQNGGTVAR